MQAVLVIFVFVAVILLLKWVPARAARAEGACPQWLPCPLLRRVYRPLFHSMQEEVAYVRARLRGLRDATPAPVSPARPLTRRAAASSACCRWRRPSRSTSTSVRNSRTDPSEWRVVAATSHRVCA
jgi:hypothetical protein